MDGVKKLMERLRTISFSVLFDEKYKFHIATILIVCEVWLNCLIIRNVAYTEIDWKAYMQEVEGVWDRSNGTFDYTELKGDTGPLVYPATFVWIYSLLFWVTNYGTNIVLAQIIFMIIYVLNLILVFRLMIRTKQVPPLAMIVMSLTSYRVHSIYVLRLFNDTIAMFLFYVSVNLFVTAAESRSSVKRVTLNRISWWCLGSVFYSLGVGVKMNILLFAPALLLIYMSELGIIGTIFQLMMCATVQVVTALPFLIHHPMNYFRGAFDFQRVFVYQWTVNWRFLNESTFLDPKFHVCLLFGHVLCLLLLSQVVWRWLHSSNTSPTNKICLPLFVCNIIGILFARSLHYQFYVWYYHSIPFLLFTNPLVDIIHQKVDKVSTPHKFMFWGLIEYCWNEYPSTRTSSFVLFMCNLVLLISSVRTLCRNHIHLSSFEEVGSEKKKKVK